LKAAPIAWAEAGPEYLREDLMGIAGAGKPRAGRTGDMFWSSSAALSALTGAFDHVARTFNVASNS